MKKVFWVIIILLLLLILGSVGGVYYLNRNSKQATEKINSGIAIASDSSQKTQEVELKAMDSIVNLTETADFETFLEQKPEIDADLEAVKKLQDEKLNLVATDDDSDINDFFVQVKSSVEADKLVMGQLETLYNFNFCIAGNFEKQYAWKQEIQTQWQVQDENLAIVRFVELSRQSAALLRSAAEELPKIKDCYVGQFQPLFDFNYETAIEEDRKLFVALADSLDKLAGSVEVLNKDDFLAGKQQVNDNLQKQTSFIGQTQRKLKEVAEKFSNETSSQQDLQAKVLQEKLDKLEQKYFYIKYFEDLNLGY